MSVLRWTPRPAAVRSPRRPRRRRPVGGPAARPRPTGPSAVAPSHSPPRPHSSSRAPPAVGHSLRHARLSGRGAWSPCRPRCCRAAPQGQPIRFDLGQESVTGRFTHIEHNRAYTAWTGELDVDSGSFTIVRSGRPPGLDHLAQGAVRGHPGRGSRYWLTAVAPYAGPSSGADTITRGPPAPRASNGRRDDDCRPQRSGARPASTCSSPTPRQQRRPRAARRRSRPRSGRRRPSTNLAFDNSGIKAKIRVKGIVKVKGTESNNVIKDLRRLQRPRDGKFDSALRARAKRHADIVHLFSGGPADRTVRRGALPYTRPRRGSASRGCPRRTSPACPTSSRRTSSVTTWAPTTSPTPASPTTRGSRAPTAGTTCRTTSSRRWATTARVRTSATSPACGSPSSPTRRELLRVPHREPEGQQREGDQEARSIVARYAR